MSRFSRYVVAAAIVLITFAAINILTPLWPCHDCFRPHGVPFSYYHEGGFGGEVGWDRGGLLKDIALILALSIGTGFVWDIAARRAR